MTLYLIKDQALKASTRAFYASQKIDPSPLYDVNWDHQIHHASRRVVYAVRDLLVYVKDALR